MCPARNLLPRLLAVALLLVVAAGCSGDSGDRAAERQLDEVAESIGREALQHWAGDTDPVWLALWAADDSHPMADAGADHRYAVDVRPLSWRRAGSAGVLEVRIRVDADGHAAVSFGDRSYGKGTATRCLRMVVGQGSRQIGCRHRAVPPLPEPPAVPALDDQAAAGLRAALRRPTLPAATGRAQVLFPEFSVRSDIVDGSWVLVITRSREYACLAGVRDQQGKIRIVVPQRRVMQPGEGGCDPYAILHPPQTH